MVSVGVHDKAEAHADGQGKTEVSLRRPAAYHDDCGAEDTTKPDRDSVKDMLGQECPVWGVCRIRVRY